MSAPFEKYKEFILRYNEVNNNWEVVYEEQVVRTRANLTEARKAADDFFKVKNAFKRVKVFGWWRYGYGPDSETPSDGEITSISEGEYSPTVWVTWRDKNRTERGKKQADQCVLDTPENRNLLAQYMELKKQETKLRNEADTVRESMKRYKINTEAKA